MKFSVVREALLKPLQLVAGVVERKQTMPVLANVLLEVKDNVLTLTGSDLEVELVGHITLDECQEGRITVPARKLMDICKSLPDSAVIELSVDDTRAVIRSGRSRFTLSTLPADEFPNIQDMQGDLSVVVAQNSVRKLIEKTGFAMANQDVRYYLNGMLFEVADGQLRVVATDGHRLATAIEDAQVSGDLTQVIVPRKGVLELNRLLSDTDETVELQIGSNHIRAKVADYIFTSKLVEGKFPDYHRVIPRNNDKIVIADRLELRQVFLRASILSNEKYRGVRLILTNGMLQVFANNPEQEEAEESVLVQYQGENLEVGFNVSYLLDVLGVVNSQEVRISLNDATASALVEEADSHAAQYVVMPMRL
ncbi:MAG: DNA polymerase III subunit beta [Marinomonas sp.]|jgi:DNA polymerase-3 subunit beta|uniref:DNA polymerase III subunit beta n=1 Tax=unclassified Marinomonas TaxID=196814 RepID=UPI0005FA5E32|nr:MULTISPECIES: DNA polymerase III subunit beta [unclassified Marinomonas]KJZ15722.1 DNA polymerase III subunit beta [Marinomonas sp. S3726]KZM40522.1 DNA polymerase III subunit beta [Marinomonas sp. SBI22]KZM42225.1 DNA polymerase III subunit beta [Marinomonas sp. SBI8L]